MIECSVCKGAFDGIAEFEKHLTAEHKLTISSTQIVHYLEYLEQRHQVSRPPVSPNDSVSIARGSITLWWIRNSQVVVLPIYNKQ